MHLLEFDGRFSGWAPSEALWLQRRVCPCPRAPNICGVGQKACKGGVCQLSFFSVKMKRETSALVKQTRLLLMPVSRG